MRRKLRLAGALVALGVLAPARARADIDTFGYGDGHAGALTVSAAGTVVNSYARLAADVAVNDTQLSLSVTTGFSPGSLVLVARVAGLTPPPASGATAAIDLTASPVGLWELARVASVSGSTLTLTAPILNAFTALGTEVVMVPEYTDLTIVSSASIVASPWDGATGGILAFMSRGTLTNNGRISAEASGFRGGAYVQSASLLTACAGLDEAGPGGALKGEGLAVAALAGRGNIANAGGGADCSRAGGAGGGNASQGGAGGGSETSDGARAVGGIGGAPLTFSLSSRLAFGGGGGAGQGSSGDGGPGSRGGGVVFVRGSVLAGAGTISARGGTYSDAVGNPRQAGVDGGGGGGAGGSVYMRFNGGVACAAIDVRGGDGASLSSEGHGPGGGGAGGRLLLQAGTATCPPNLAGGAAGAAPSGATNGASAGGAGSVESPPRGGFCAGKLDCGGATPVCDVANGVCLECVGPGDCADPAKPVCETAAGPLKNRCTQCTRAVASACKADKPICRANDTCGCEKNGDCPSSLHICDPTTHACIANCLADADCTAQPFLRCDKGATPSACVQCLADADCSGGRVCSTARACTECTQANAKACSASGSGAICLGNNACGCATDTDCGDAASGRVCDKASHACALGCRGTNGNGCPTAFRCTSTDATVGQCQVPLVDAGTDDAGSNVLTDHGKLGGGGAGCGVDGSAAGSREPTLLLIAGWLGISVVFGRRLQKRSGKGRR